MTRAQALKLARAKWGKEAYLRDTPNASTKAQRDAADEELRAHRTRKPVIPESTEPYAELMEQRDDYRKRLLEWRQIESTLMWVALSYRYSVGFRSPLAFHVRGTGDTWEEACRKAGLL